MSSDNQIIVGITVSHILLALCVLVFSLNRDKRLSEKHTRYMLYGFGLIPGALGVALGFSLFLKYQTAPLFETAFLLLLSSGGLLLRQVKKHGVQV